ncbi:hypothetical protein V8C86DRAFT_1147357 [Haematococcus lacustris]
MTLHTSLVVSMAAASAEHLVVPGRLVPTTGICPAGLADRGCPTWALGAGSGWTYQPPTYHTSSDGGKLRGCRPVHCGMPHEGSHPSAPGQHLAMNPSRWPLLVPGHALICSPLAGPSCALLLLLLLHTAVLPRACTP